MVWVCEASLARAPTQGRNVLLESQTWGSSQGTLTELRHREKQISLLIWGSWHRGFLSSWYLPTVHFMPKCLLRAFQECSHLIPSVPFQNKTTVIPSGQSKGSDPSSLRSLPPVLCTGIGNFLFRPESPRKAEVQAQYGG